MSNYVNKIDKDLFEDIILFSMSEPGAMGPAGTMTFYTRAGDHFKVDYESETTPYGELREMFPLMKECCWRGPMKLEVAAAVTIVIGGSDDQAETKVPEGWRHIYLDVGNHLAVKQEFYFEVKKILDGKDNSNITFHWPEMLDKAGFADCIENIETINYEQQEKDAQLFKKLAGVQNNPEYIKKVNEATGDVDKMMQVFEEYSGIKMTAVELKQAVFRQLEREKDLLKTKI